MFFRIYKYNHPIIIIIILLSAVLLWLPAFLQIPYSEPLTFSFEMPAYYWLIQYFQDKIYAIRIISFVLILFQAIQINRLNTKFFILESRSYLPSFIFIFGCSLIPMHNLNALVFANIFLLFAIESIFSTYRNDKAWLKYFDAGLLLSIASLFYIKLAFFILFIWIGLLILRPFRGKEWLVSIIGFLIPYIISGSYFLIFEDNFIYRVNLFINQLFSFYYPGEYDLLYLIYLGFLSILVIFSSYHIIVHLQKRKVSVRKYYQLLFWLFIISISLFVLGRFHNTEIILIIMVSVSFLVSNYILSFKSNFWTEILLSIFAGIIIIIQLINYTKIVLF
ncbi:hypothetical protein ACFLTE_06905 [Bacteroidota bacterium]